MRSQNFKSIPKTMLLKNTRSLKIKIKHLTMQCISLRIMEHPVSFLQNLTLNGTRIMVNCKKNMENTFKKTLMCADITVKKHRFHATFF